SRPVSSTGRRCRDGRGRPARSARAPRNLHFNTRLSPRLREKSRKPWGSRNGIWTKGRGHSTFHATLQDELGIIMCLSSQKVACPLCPLASEEGPALRFAPASGPGHSTHRGGVKTRRSGPRTAREQEPS